MHGSTQLDNNDSGNLHWLQYFVSEVSLKKGARRGSRAAPLNRSSGVQFSMSEEMAVEVTTSDRVRALGSGRLLG